MKRYINVDRKVIKRKGHTYNYYRARLVFPIDPLTNIRPRPKSFYGKSAKEAAEKRESYRNAVKHSQPNRLVSTSPEAITLGTFIRDAFLPFETSRYEKAQLSGTRLRDRSSRIRRFVTEDGDAARLRNSNLAKLPITAIEDFFRNLAINRRVSPEVFNLIRRDMILILKMAKRRIPHPWTEYFEEIPEQRVTRRLKKLFDAEKIEQIIWNESLPCLSRLSVAIEYIVNCRPSEMFALRWADVDFTANTLTFDDAIIRDLNGYRRRDHTKGGERSDRIVPIPPELTQMFRQVQKQRFARGRVTSEYVLCNRNGGPYNKDSFRKAWADIKIDLGLPDGPTFYSLKTLGNSRARALGVTGHAQALKMGHSSTRMSDTAYRALQSLEMDKAVEVFRPRKKRRRRHRKSA